jgi:hypothetical protein
VVAAGLTVSVPPLAAARVWLVPSEPVTVTVVAFVATTVRVDDFPRVMDVGLATMVTVDVVSPA